MLSIFYTPKGDAQESAGSFLYCWCREAELDNNRVVIIGPPSFKIVPNIGGLDCCKAGLGHRDVVDPVGGVVGGNPGVCLGVFGSAEAVGSLESSRERDFEAVAKAPQASAVRRFTVSCVAPDASCFNFSDLRIAIYAN